MNNTRKIHPQDRWILNSSGNIVGVQSADANSAMNVEGYDLPTINPTTGEMSGLSKALAAIGQLQVQTLGKTSVPVIVVGSGTINASGVLTLTTALTAAPSGAWVYLPSGAISGGLAGLYWSVWSSASQAQIYTKYINPSAGFVAFIPTDSLVNAVGSGSYTQLTGTPFTVFSVNVPGGLIGNSGVLRLNPVYTGSGAGNKTYNYYLGGGGAFDSNAFATGTAAISMSLRASGTQTRQLYTFRDNYSKDTTFNLAADALFSIRMVLATATDSAILNSAILDVIPDGEIYASAAVSATPHLGVSRYMSYVAAHPSDNLMSIAIATDCHCGVDAINNLATIARLAGTTYVANLGDMLQTDAPLTINDYWGAVSAANDLVTACNGKYIGLMGNHEGIPGLSPAFLNENAWRSIMQPKLSSELAATLTFGSSAHSNLLSTSGTRPYWFFDDSAFKIRFIHINPYYYTPQTYAATNAELTWLANTACNFSAKGGDAGNWRVIVLTHGALTGSYDAGGARVYSEPEKLFSALHSGGSYVNAGAGINVTFTTAIPIIGHFFGDLHNDVRYTDATLKYQDCGLMSGRWQGNFVHADYNSIAPDWSVYKVRASILCVNLTARSATIFVDGPGTDFTWSF